jgi:uncharacterized membrane protein
MKKTNIFYWIFTGLFAAFMLFSGVMNMMVTPDSVDLIVNQLGYPEYFVFFVGLVKILWVIGILVPGFPRVTEWAYAGLFFDLFSAVYSMVAALGFKPDILGMALPFALGVLSYGSYHKKLKMLA